MHKACAGHGRAADVDVRKETALSHVDIPCQLEQHTPDGGGRHRHGHHFEVLVGGN